MRDALAVACSGLCLCHCLLTPVLIAMGSLGMFAAVFESEMIHQILLAPVVCLALTSLPFSFRRHLRWPPLWLGALGGSFLVASVTAPESREALFAVPAGLLLIGAHLLNRHYLITAEAERC